MTMLHAADAIFREYPDVVLGVVAFPHISNAGEQAELIDALRLEEAQTIARFANSSIAEHAQIVPWREAYRRFGAKPKDYPFGSIIARFG